MNSLVVGVLVNSLVVRVLVNSLVVGVLELTSEVKMTYACLTYYTSGQDIIAGIKKNNRVINIVHDVITSEMLSMELSS